MNVPVAPAYADFRKLRFSAGGHPLTRLLSQRLGARLAWLAYRIGLSPSAVTVLGLTVFLATAGLYATLPAGIGPALACLVLLQLGYALDCADGQLARATARTSAFGGWLDLACDYVRTVALAAAVLLWLVTRGQALEVATICTAVFLAGAAVHIHTAAVLRSSGPAELQPSAAGQRLRWTVTALCDTATLLLLLAGLREAPALLAPYLAAIGILYLAISLYLVRARPA